ncbi:MAG TPA: sensor histidine kinase [Candidatus Binatia bacterium]|nr:sensor histidine kinase [Candidatus Binatia bacterium]
MDRFPQQILRSRRLPALIVGLTLAVFGVSIYFGTLHLRKKVQAQIVRRDADILYAVALMQQLNQQEESQLGDEIENVADQLNVALQISQLKGVIATRLFDAQGNFTFAFPAYVPAAALTAADLPELKRLKPGSRFYPRASLAPFLFMPASQKKTAPLLEVNIPIHRKEQSQLLGVAQFIIDGENIASEFLALDRSLLLQGAAVFVVGAFIIVVILMGAFRRLQTAGQLVLERTEKLVRANEELALAARTSAVGAVTAHLIHRLSNPLSGLQDFVTNRGGDAQMDWDDAAATADEMQRLIADIIRLLGEEQMIDRYEISFTELAELIGNRVEMISEKAGVHFTTVVNTAGMLANREGSLTALILENLVRNAIEATPSGKKVCLLMRTDADNLICEVRDEGSGIPETLRGALFTPCRSRKLGGHGIGLAICKQLANHLGASLELKTSDESGSIFALTVPTLSEERLLASGDSSR